MATGPIGNQPSVHYNLVPRDASPVPSRYNDAAKGRVADGYSLLPTGPGSAEARGWKAELAAKFKAVGQAIAAPFQQIKHAIERKWEALTAPSTPRASAPKDPASIQISSPVPRDISGGPIRDAFTAGGAGLSMLPAVARDGASFKAVQGLLQKDVKGSDAALAHTAHRMGLQLAEALKDAPRSVQQQFALSDGKRLISDLIAPTKFESLSPAKQDVLLKMFDQVAKSLPDQQNADGTITVNGTTYEQVKRLGGGAFGEVSLYTEKLGPGEQGPARQLAVKHAKGDTSREVQIDGPLAEARNMVNLTGTGAGRGADNFVKLEGVLRNTDGEVLIAMEVAGRGGVDGVMHELRDRAAKGEISPEQFQAAVLTVLKDIANAGQRMGDAKGVVHFDLRPVNLLMGSDGMAKVADPGVAKVSGEAVRAATGMPESASGEVSPDRYPVKYQAPEVVGPQQTGSSASDVFSLGVTLYQLMHGEQHHPLGLGGGMSSATAAVRLQNLTTNDLLKPGAEPNGLSTPQPLMDLINSMLHPDPAQRATFEQVLASPLLNNPAVGSPEIRALLGNKPTAPVVNSLGSSGPGAVQGGYSDSQSSQPINYNLGNDSVPRAERATPSDSLGPRGTSGSVSSTATTNPSAEPADYN